MPAPVLNPANPSNLEQPTSGARSRQRGASRRYSKIVRGVKATVKAAIPNIGSGVVVDGVPCRVVSVDYQPDRNGATATLTINAVKSNGGTADDEITWEVEMAQLEKSIVSHPKYSAYADDIRAWQDDPSVSTSGYADAALQCIAKLKQGVDSYLVFAPVVRKTTVTGNPVSVGSGLGKRVSAAPTPSGVTVAGDWKWLKTRDSVSVDGDGIKRHVEEWTGADKWDADIYS